MCIILIDVIGYIHVIEIIMAYKESKKRMTCYSCKNTESCG